LSRRGFLMMTDVIIAMMLVSFTVIMVNQLLSNSVDYDNNYLQSLTSDAAALIEASGLDEAQAVVNSAPEQTCLKAIIREYNGSSLSSENVSVTTGCPSDYSGEVSASTRTYTTDTNNYLIIINGWQRWVKQ